MPNNWKETTLGEMAEINPSESLKVGTLAKYVAMGHLTPFTREIAQYEVKEFKGGSKFRNGDTLLARITPCLENGKTAFVDLLNEGEVAFGSTEFIIIREKKETSDKKFLFYFALSPAFREEAIKSMTGTSGRQRVQTDLVANKLFEFPSLPEQKAIAAILSSFDDKIELLRRQNKTLEKIAQTIFKEWFVNFTVNGKKLKIDNSTGLPEGWRVGKLIEEFEIIMGQSPDGRSYNESAEGMIFFQGRAEFQERFPSVRLYTTEPKRIAERFDVLVSVRAPVGDINVASNRCCIGRGLAAVRGKYKSYALYKIKSLKDAFNKFEAEGTVFGSIGKDAFADIEAIIPNNETLKSFEATASNIDAKIYNNNSQIQTLSKLRDTLLPKLMKGEMRVKG